MRTCPKHPFSPMTDHCVLCEGARLAHSDRKRKHTADPKPLMVDKKEDEEDPDAGDLIGVLDEELL